MKTKIKVNKNGPFIIDGEFELVDAEGQAFDLGGRSVVSLCRCGQTTRAPFCDGSHSRCSFSSEVVAYALPPKK
ncbi:MAG: CDGSH iron-sulfur domain-containing protein [Bdellovibrionales bacterium]|nr:CDGSH iron-sulfur domain-containing protein [Bdellovibrionales bacterium]